ncbi:MAG: ABC transporter ATP-binding protein [Ignavibacteriae bacterium]|nr:ABC transporter ATP-binding protein [Ignavibacteriota bacterium]
MRLKESYRMLLSVKELGVSVAQNGEYCELLHDISFSLKPGEIFTIIGESGSGKTTLARALTNLFPPHWAIERVGVIEFENLDLAALDEKDLNSLRRQSIRYIFQEPALAFNPVLKIKRQIQLALHTTQCNGMDDSNDHESFHTLLHQLDINDLEGTINAYPHQLSVGTLQRIHIALAIAPKPKLLIADEPTSSVDALQSVQILTLLRSYCKRYTMGMLLITHDLGIAEHFADTIAILSGGRIVECAPKDRFFQQPRHPYSQLLVEKTSNNEHA